MLASTPARPGPATRRGWPAGRSHARVGGAVGRPVAASASPTPTPTPGEQAAAAVRQFAAKHRLKQRASTAAATAADAAARAAARLDAALHLRRRAAAARDAAASAARDADEHFGLRARVRRAAADAARVAPRHWRRVRAFLDGPGGPPTFAAVIFALAWLGWLGRILNFCVLLWWAAPLLGLPFAAVAARRQAAEAEAAAARARERAAQRGPFGGWPGWGKPPPPPPSSQGGGGGAVIDVEYDVLDGR